MFRLTGQELIATSAKARGLLTDEEVDTRPVVTQEPGERSPTGN